MKTVLFLGHEYHLKTKSSRFFIELLKERYDVTCVFFDPYTNRYSDYAEGIEYDFLILWQIMPERMEIEKKFKYGQGIIIPMYDAVVGNRSIDWMQYCDFKALCFCKKLYDELVIYGINALYVQYFIGYKGEFEAGEEDSVFFWQRKQTIDTNTLEMILKDTEIRHLHIHKAMDPKHSFELSKTLKWDITFSDWFENQEDYTECVLRSAFYVAPREYEGIGMSFLEAMSMGRCVIAPNNATMNDYIEDGINGILYDIDDLKPIKKYDIRMIQKNAYEYSKQGYLKWKSEKNKILDWMEIIEKKPIYADQCIAMIISKQQDRDKQNSYYSVLNQWLSLRQRGKSLSTYFECSGYKTIAIYGMKDLGERLCEELKDSGIVVSYGIDRNYANINAEMIVVSPEDNLRPVDVIVVTSFFYYDEIRLKIEEKVECPIISLQEIVGEFYAEQANN